MSQEGLSVLVPREPNRDMTMAGAGCLPSVDGVFGIAGALSANVYRAMIAAAPTPPLPVEDGELVREARDVIRAWKTPAHRLTGYDVCILIDRLVSRIEDGGRGSAKPITPERAEVSPSPHVESQRQHGFNLGVRAAIAWLHRRADEMTDPHARSILNSAAFNFGVDKPASGATCLPQALSAEGDSLCTAEPAAAEASCPADVEPSAGEG